MPEAAAPFYPSVRARVVRPGQSSGGARHHPGHPGEDLAREVHLVLVDAVAGARVDARGHLGAKRAHHGIGLAHAPDRDVWVALAAPEQDWHALERPDAFRRRGDRVANQAAAEAYDGAEALGVLPG